MISSKRTKLYTLGVTACVLLIGCDSGSITETASEPTSLSIGYETVTPRVASATGCGQIDIESASSSYEHDANYNPDLTIDGQINSASRWASKGVGNTIVFDLGNEYQVTEIRTAWYWAQVRSYYFDVETSTNGTNWQSVLGDAIAHGTQGFIDFDVADSDARYVRIVGNGNSHSYWNILTEIEIHGCSNEDQGSNSSIELIQELFDLEGGDDDLSPYQSNGQLVFDALQARHVTSGGNGWRHELKKDSDLRVDMWDTAETLRADVTIDISDGGKVIFAQYHGSSGTIVKLYLSDTDESSHYDSIPNNGIFDVYARVRENGESGEQLFNFGTTENGDSFEFYLSADDGEVTMSALGRTAEYEVIDKSKSYLKFGSYSQAVNPTDSDDKYSSSEWEDFYDDFDITKAKVTFSNVEYFTDN